MQLFNQESREPTDHPECGLKMMMFAFVNTRGRLMRLQNTDFKTIKLSWRHPSKRNAVQERDEDQNAASEATLLVNRIETLGPKPFTFMKDSIRNKEP